MIAGACKYEARLYPAISLHLILSSIAEFFPLCIGMVLNGFSDTDTDTMLYDNDVDDVGCFIHAFVYIYDFMLAGFSFWLFENCGYIQMVKRGPSLSVRSVILIRFENCIFGPSKTDDTGHAWFWQYGKSCYYLIATDESVHCGPNRRVKSFQGDVFLARKRPNG